MKPCIISRIPSPSSLTLILHSSTFLSSFILHPFVSFAPTLRHFVPVVENSLQSSFNNERSEQATQKPKWRFVVYFISEDCSIVGGVDDVAMTPASKGSFDLYIFK